MSEQIFVALSTFGEFGDEPLKLLEQSGIKYTLNPEPRRIKREDLIKLGRDATGIIAGVEPYDSYVLERLPRLKCISRCGVGIDSIDLNYAREKGIVIRNTPDVVIQPVVELTIAMIFDLMKRLTQHTILMQKRRWEKKAANLLAGKTVGIIGLGRIGRRVSETLVSLGANVIGSDIYPDEMWAKKAEVTIVSEEGLLGKADIISIHVSPLAEHPFILGRKQIETMKNGAWVVNVSRGNLIDEQALLEAFQSGRLSGGALDVFPEEPYDGPLCDMENVIMTPHIATLTKESRLQMEIEAVQNVISTLISLSE